ncbi:hypothetical protein [Paenibacillus rigui]|uniref:Uncharacterized protein n=1 Tax=Paenibacillus rigui TaxID=554312 RepID=A0A229UQB0_9BACL|nr:hypothetical protein [Paenibacillus rigui]OXM85069.1 hypothetical protein CF651_15765 [Paenibacillus rigui]
MKYLVFNPTVRSEFPYPAFLDRLPQPEAVIQMEAAALPGLKDWNAEEYTAIVASPFWITTVLSFRPKKIICWMEPCPKGVAAGLWNKYYGLLAASSQLVVTPSERIYMEQCLQRDAVFWIETAPAVTQEEQAHHMEQEQILDQALAAFSCGEPLELWVTKQWEARERYYTGLHAVLGPHETISYLLASYQYFLGRPEARDTLTVSFEQMLLQDFHDCLHSHVRFFSAMEARFGSLEKAVRQFEITAFSAEDRALTAKLYQWLQQGWPELVKAELYRVNEDYRSAIQLLERMPEEGQAPLLKLQNYIHVFRWEEALTFIDRSLLPLGYPAAEPILRGTLHLIHNRRRMAITDFLRESMKDWHALSHLDDMAAFEQASLAILTGEEKVE